VPIRSDMLDTNAPYATPFLGPVVHADDRTAGLLAEVAAALLGADDGMAAALAVIGRYAGAERASVLVPADPPVDGDGPAPATVGHVRVAHRWSSAGVRLTGEDVQTVPPAWWEQLLGGEPVCAPVLPDPLPAEPATAPATPGPLRTLLLPARAGDDLVAVLRLDAGAQDACDPTVSPVGLGTLRTVADLCGGALARAARTAELVASEQRCRSMLDEIGAVVVRLGPDGSVTFVNQAWTELTGISVADTLGKSAMHHVHPDDRAVAAQHLTATIEGNNELRAVRFFSRDGGVRWMEVHGRVLHDASGGLAGFAGTVHDVTERRAAELHAEEARDRAELARDHAERASKAKSEFLSRMSHELRTPLNAILGFTELLQLGEPSPDDAELLTHIGRAGQYLLQLINDSLDVARIETGRMAVTLQPVDLADGGERGMELIQPMAAEHAVTLAGLPQTCQDMRVLADERLILQVLVNLLSNAAKYNQAGGSVTVDCYPLTVVTPDGVPAEHGWLRVAVRDTGVGLPPDRLDDVFLPFERLGAEYGEVEGSGLGLSLTKSMVEAMGGQIGAESIQGIGTIFHVDLPSAGPAEESAAA
jgi:PAS domain S-box-containing protein